MLSQIQIAAVFIICNRFKDQLLPYCVVRPSDSVDQASVWYAILANTVPLLETLNFGRLDPEEGYELLRRN